MTNKLVILTIVLLARGGCDCILVGPATNSSNETSAPGEKQDDALKIKELDSNSTFYYDSDAFLLNKSDSLQTETRRQPNGSSASNKTTTQRADEKQFAPASFGSSSGRNGRMLDLDALMGDMSASKANKQRQADSGNRQSRYLSDVQSNLDIGGGKRLHIQGFIPIVGVKDDNEPEAGGEVDSSALMKQKPKMTQLMNKHNNELPYAQSSMGHATFGVQRYLNTDVAHQQQQQQQYQQSEASYNQQVDAKFGGAGSMVDTLKRPIKKLTSLAGGSGSQQQQASHSQQNCLCVPFYMCKNGFISESSLGKAQIQQMISQQQQQHQLSQQPRQIDTIPSMDLKMGSVESIPMQAPMVQQQQQQQQQQPVAPVSLVDERSLDRDIITASPMSLADNQGPDGANMSIGTALSMDTTSTAAPPQATFDAHLDSSISSASTSTSTSMAADQPSETVNNSTLADPMNNDQLASDFSQDILGRMLGLKANSRLSSAGTGGGPPPTAGSSTGVCGLLRTCCQIPTNTHSTSQQDQHSNGNKLIGPTSPTLNQQLMLEQTLLNQALQKYQAAAQQQQQLQQTYQQVPYGLPLASSQISRMQQPANNLMIDNHQQQQQQQLVHRTSNQYPAATGAGGGSMGRFQSALSQQINQYTRAAAPMQPLQSFQQQQHQQLAQLYQPKINRQTSVGQLAPQAPSQQPLYQAAGLGTRRLLEGRCGLRQSAGITGRVQNLQYHESSADFGEYPAQAAILKRLNGSESLFVCGGTLVSQYWVATAAHCIKKHAQADLKVRLGEWDVHRDDEFYSYVEKEVRDIVIHSEFTSGVYLVNDLALIRLESPVDASLPHVNPACLPAMDEQFSGQRCWVTGWGKDSFGQRGSFQAVLREVELPVIGHHECESALRRTRLGAHYRLHAGFMCAGGEGGKDACEGDGGSGLYCVQPDGLIKVAGLVSWGIGCGQQGVPGVYVNLAHYRPWIENIISIDEDVYSKNSAPTGTTPPTTTTAQPASQ